MHPFLKLTATFSEDNHARGKQFERLCKWILETDPVYSNKIEKVWFWNDWPERWGPDCGIDLIAQDTERKIWAIQAKCYNPDYSVTKQDIDSFISESGNDKIDIRLLIATTDKIAPNAVNVIHRTNTLRPFNQLLLTELLEKQLEWPASLDALSSGSVKKPFTPKPHQRAAIDDVITGLGNHDRGQLIMACGTGKTLAGLWIAQEINSSTTLVLLPSLLLLSKTLAEWLRHSRESFSYLPVCSDDSVAKSDDDSINFTTSDLSFPSTTSETEIANFLQRDGKKVIFSTYQSSPQIAAAYKKGKLKPLDLVISDEAHRCAGKAGADYTTALDNTQIPATKRLFMTATPKIFQAHSKKAAEESGVEVLSMDDTEIFGPVLHKLSFGTAIEQNLLSDYQVVVVGVDDSLCAEMISERRLIQTENKIESDAQSFASHIGLAKAIKSYDLRRVITFHSRVKSANDFQQDFSAVVDWMPEVSRPSGSFITNYVSGAMSTSQRNQNLRRLGELAEGERAILSNARCLSEGVDVPALDGVAFIDPRNSEIDIVQAVGRAIRLSSSKTVGTIVIPVFIAEHDDPNEVLNSSAFKKVWAVVNALRSHDDALGIELDSLRQALGKRGSVGRSKKIYFDLPTTISVDFEKALSIKIIESTTASWEFWFGLLEKYKEQYGDCSPSAKFRTLDAYSLGSWVSVQRLRKKDLILNRIQRLDDLGLIWEPFIEQWENGYSHLVEYKKVQRDCLVPKTFKTSDGYPLGAWVGTQRVNKEQLSTKQLERLQALDFVWDSLTERWENGYSHLVEYKKAHRDCLVLRTFKTSDGYPLANWVGNQRANKEQLSTKQLERLQALDFVWDSHITKWENGYSHLKAYKEEYGSCTPSAKFRTSDDYSLGSWVVVQRTNKEQLSPERIKCLDELGFVWDPSTLQWEEGFAYLKAYKEQHGDCLVPQRFKTPDGFNLGSWVSTQRAAKEILAPERIQCLEKLGFVWDKLTEQWEKGFAYLKAYKEHNGDILITSEYKTSDGYNLGRWIRKQRSKKHNLNQERIQRLEELGFVWK